MKGKNYLYNCLLLAVLGMFASCANEAELASVSEPVEDAVEFVGTMQSSSVQTRAGEDEGDIWLDMPYDTWKWTNTDTPVDFYIRQQVSEGTSPNLSIYNLQQGEVGRLKAKQGQTALSWVSKNASHRFHVWTQPAGVTIEENGTETGTVDIKTNNLDYEYFVGETAGPVTYGTNGLTVGLRFEHLISKIVIDRITLIKSDGSTNGNVWSKVRSIMFPNMPVKGTFTTGVKEGDPEMKVIHSTEVTDRGVTFKTADHFKHSDKGDSISFYLLPQKFNLAAPDDYGKFYVSLIHPTAEEFRMYEGNLNQLVNEDDPENKLDKIEAGECLKIHLILKDDEVHGFYTHIQDWNTVAPNTSSDSPYPSIGSAEDIERNFTEQDGKIVLNKAFLEDIVYEEVEVGEEKVKVVRLSDNIDLSKYPNITLVIPDGYMLDGCGFGFICSGLKIEGTTQNLTINGVAPSTSSEP